MAASYFPKNDFLKNDGRGFQPRKDTGKMPVLS
jgi:hypothetical protein